MLREAWNAAKDGGAEQDAAYDLRDDLRLLDFTQHEGKYLGRQDNDAQLYDE